MKQRVSQSIPVPMMLASDLFGFFFTILPVTGTYLSLFFIGKELWDTPIAFSLFIVFSLYIACFILFLNLFILRLFIPKVRPGVYRIGANRGFLAWYLNFFANRALTLSGLKRIVFTNSILRFLYTRVMGGKISFQTTSSMGVDFVDLPLIEVGSGTTMSEGVTLSAHSFTGESLFLSSVKIGKNVFLGMDVVAGPGTTIGDDSWIGGRNTFIADKIPAGSLFPNHAWSQGNPKKAEKTEIRLGPAPETK